MITEKLKLTDGPEYQVLSREQAEQTATGFVGSDDPYPDVPPSLMATQHFVNYVKATGMIGPFFAGGESKSRLKKASYEGRIGSRAYKFNKDKNLEKIDFSSGELLVEANSIVFVECDLDFRLPDFIAIRFNLQIRHVHRGLLLGTGPLVDPGFWGKLCIPLHNLTDENYSIPLTDGLIWVEFTKTTSDHSLGRRALGDREFWDIEELIWKAAKQFDPEGNPIAIRSSIPLVAMQAAIDAKKASDEASASAKAVETATEAARNAEREARNATQQLSKLGSFVGAGVVVAVIALWTTFLSEVNERNNGAIKTVESIEGKFEEKINKQEKIIDGYFRGWKTEIEQMKVYIKELETKNRSLENAVDAIRAASNSKPQKNQPNGAKPSKEAK